MDGTHKRRKERGVCDLVTVVCKVVNCPFHSTLGFCRSRFVAVQQNGMCRNLLQPIDHIQDFMYDGWRPQVKQGDVGQIEEKE